MSEGREIYGCGSQYERKKKRKRLKIRDKEHLELAWILKHVENSRLCVEAKRYG